jgi:hypothetical protein
MASVSSDVTVRDVRLLPGGEREEGRCYVQDLLIYTANSPSLLLVIYSNNKSLNVFNVDTWRCVSHCVLDSLPRCMYELSGSVFIHCRDLGLYQVTSMSPLAVTRHGQTGVGYMDIAVLDETRLIAVSAYSHPCIQVLGHRGDLLADLTKTCDSYVIRPGRVTCHAGRVIVLDRDYPRRVVCMRVSPDNHVTHEWMGEDLDDAQDVLITARIIIVTCYSPNTVISLDMKSGRMLEREGLPLDIGLWKGLCVDETTSCIYAGIIPGIWTGHVAELHLQGKL